MNAMLTSVKNKIQRTALINLLTFIVEGTKTAGFVFVPKDDAEKLAKAEPSFVTLDSTVTNEDGQIKAVATQVAIDALSASSSEVAAPVAATPEPHKFEFVKLDAIPTINRGGNKSETYPFAALSAYPAEPHAFVVPVSAARPNPAKALASTVASANKRTYPEPTPKRSFTVRKHVDASGKLLGALIIRTA